MTKTDMDYSYGVIPVIKTGAGFEFLLIHAAAGHWTFPKGHKDLGESDIETAKRELWEETGMTDVDIVPGAEFVTHYPVPPERNGLTQKEVKLFLGFAKDKNVKVPENFVHEILEAKWCTYEEAESNFTKPEWKKLLSEANEYLEKNF